MKIVREIRSAEITPRTCGMQSFGYKGIWAPKKNGHLATERKLFGNMVIWAHSHFGKNKKSFGNPKKSHLESHLLYFDPF